MQEVILYIEDTKVDMFKDESISLTSSIQDVRDFSKVFTDFSKSFTLPASKVNNKLFKHYYNSDIDGFDARTKKDANIELNYMPFREGKIKLNGVKMKDNKPYAYNVTFFGNTVNLKDVIGEDKLDALPLSGYDHAFDKATVVTGLTTSLSTGAIVYPLLTHTQRYTYDSDSSNTDQGNIAYHSGGGHSHGINFFDLKPAIQLKTVINAIQTKYSIAFSDDFFSASDDTFGNLYLWLHRNKGRIGATTTGQLLVSVPDNFVHTGGIDYVTFVNNDSEWLASTLPSPATSWDGLLTITPTQTGELYDIKVTDEVTGDILLDAVGVTGIQVNNINLPVSASQRDYQIKTTVSTEANLQEYVAKWDIEETVAGIGVVGTYEVTELMTSTVIISENMPNMKVIDFITGLFKTFNLTAYVSGKEILVEPLDAYYAKGGSYDITEYVDVNSGDVNSALPFREVSFKYQVPKTFLADAFNDQNNKEFGTLEYTSGQKLDGGKYEIKLPFEHMVFERLTDAGSAGGVTDSQYGYFVDDKQEPLIAAPLIFYNINQTVGTKKMVYLNTSNETIGTGGDYTTYNRPSNTSEAPTADYTLNFGSEFDEWDAAMGLNDNSLFGEFYTTYITDTFNLKNRLTKITAFLPLRILLNYSLNDRFIVNGKSYKINSINTNLQNGKSQIELLNDFS